MAEDRLDALFDLPPEEFTAARDELARVLREQGDKGSAAEVRGLRRPTVPAWVVNQVARQHRGELQELLSVGSELREAHRKAVSGGGTEELADMGARRRRVVDRLLERAQAILEDAGRPASRATLDRAADTLLAATMDEEAAAVVGAGRLERELAPPSGFEAALGDLPADAGEKPRRGDRRDAERLERARRKAEEARREAAQAQREARRLAGEADDAARQARRAEERAARAAERAEEAERAAEELSKVSRR